MPRTNRPLSGSDWHKGLQLAVLYGSDDDASPCKPPPRTGDSKADLRRLFTHMGNFHKHCRLPACGRHQYCARIDDCQFVRDVPLTDEEIEQANAAIRNALDEDKARREGRPWPPPDPDEQWAAALAAAQAETAD
jgi:hypothetical protein